MFTKSKSHDHGSQGLGIPPAPEPTPAPAPAPSPLTAAAAPRAPEPSRPAPRSSNLSTLSAGVKYEGNISGAGELQVDGSLKGDVRVSRVVIGEGGSVEGTVHADVLDVRGRVSGAIVAKQVKLYATARVEGDITQEQLAIDQGAWFQGRCNQAKRDTPGAAMLEAPAPKPDKADKPDAKTPA
ncbi:MAG: polymer-forming cytoskeletal protein [Candidatus Brevundimonas colombiensis]|jgi:cytoskeletal protein CcmA (bactofilin family)|uniref:Polymer-forming cytoskeletal protein n=1 Tax=Candidatus Brevundimonas colombiensis TaxID=3121376 RepID=A0AAJ6BLI9_9CAUL|nr:polymer-forming cytoskeletal protein [Brevundimonas sp.]WEK39606.1 MAG: polymer-forming cytoskeletal protein [Brevundimonas sp.]